MQHFFGGAMGVFTTRSLLHSVGMSGNGATSAAVAVNWVLKVKPLKEDTFFIFIYFFGTDYSNKSCW